MAIRDVLRMGNPLLAQVAAEVTSFGTPELAQLLQDMSETMAALNGAGLAAPQIGVIQRVVIFGIDANPRYPDVEPVPRTVLINPVIEFLSDEQEQGWEGCLSVPGMRGLVPRYTHIRYSGVEQNGQPIKCEATGFHARVVQHECDHLDGILYPQRILDMKNFGYEQELLDSGRLDYELTPEE